MVAVVAEIAKEVKDHFDLDCSMDTSERCEDEMGNVDRLWCNAAGPTGSQSA